MNYKCILVKSVTYAQKAKKVLAKKGIYADISKQNKGDLYTCSWCVKVPFYEETEATKIMTENGVKLTGYVFDV